MSVEEDCDSSDPLVQNEEAKRFYRLFENVDVKLYPTCEKRRSCYLLSNYCA